MPDGRLKSIILPTEMCFPEHYVKPQSSISVQEQSHLLDGTVEPPKSQALLAKRHEDKTEEGLCTAEILVEEY